MASKKSALKRVRQTDRRTGVNRSNSSRLRTQIKALRKALAAGPSAGLDGLLRQTVAVIDRSVTKGVIHRNTANRYKSRLTKHVQALGKKA